jgi:hypothetical protein
MLEVKLKAWFSPRGSVRFLMTISPQFASLQGAGPTMSFICALTELPPGAADAVRRPE